MRARALAGMAIAGVLSACASVTPTPTSSPTPSTTEGFGNPPAACRSLDADVPLVWAGHGPVRQVLVEGTPEDVIAEGTDFQPARAVSEDVIGEIYVQAGGVSDPRWRFCVISEAGTVYAFRWPRAWEPPSS